MNPPKIDPNPFPSPKAAFQAVTGNITAHRSLFEIPALQRGLDVALMQYQRMLTDTPPADMGGAAASYLRLLGAQELVRTFVSLGQTAPVLTTPVDQNLDHKV